MKKLISPAPIVISGGGIAGLSLALYFAKYGVASIILEKASELKEIGAGLQLSPNATRLLEKIDVLKACLEKAALPTQINLINATNNQKIISLPIAQYAKSNNLSQYLTIHRADLQTVLLDAVRAQNQLIDLRLGNEVIAYTNQQQDGYVIQVKKNTGILYDIPTKLLVCADGVWSNLRPEKAVYSGYTAWRTTFLPQKAKHLGLSNYEISVFMDHSQHSVCYPICQGENYNLIMITKEELATSITVPKSNILTFAQDAQWSRWPIFSSLNINYLNQDGIIFIGDAAHSLLPFAAQGAAMAIEDAAKLAVHLCSSETFATRNNLCTYAKKRTQRIKQVKFRGNLNAYAYHAKGIIAKTRDVTMRFMGSNRLLENLNWLYKYDALKL
ncbi:FAD-dependent monooxygenase [Bartonella sp. TP]|uniref:FAD-dependent monooxygenase n=1 Tax=Bartonella sp. TP TaxID=3057550 RepID=UPI0025B21B59|nr:FAD-dependent monooxygenase [Bartonella sp. TP]MDN5249404.1 FAD-dependent monooxygenase [Alphaproteobacteria bacterium]WJW79945.1 FAD-dependent monooxygenase [Bartonella sp. TP]